MNKVVEHISRMIAASERLQNVPRPIIDAVVEDALEVFFVKADAELFFFVLDELSVCGACGTINKLTEIITTPDGDRDCRACLRALGKCPQSPKGEHAWCRGDQGLECEHCDARANRGTKAYSEIRTEQKKATIKSLAGEK